MNPALRTRLGMALLAIEKEEAKKRQESSRAKLGQRIGAGKFPPPTEALDRAGAAVVKTSDPTLRDQEFRRLAKGWLHILRIVEIQRRIDAGEPVIQAVR